MYAGCQLRTARQWDQMTVTLHISAELERSLMLEAEARGVSLDFLVETAVRRFADSVAQPFEKNSEGNLVRLEDGMWALRTGHRISNDAVNDAIEELRREREIYNTGQTP
jgi:hypothetical protein